MLGEKAAEEEAVLEAQPSQPVQAGAVFWEELLKAGYQDLQQAQMEALGKGKRERRQVSPFPLFHPPPATLLVPALFRRG